MKKLLPIAYLAFSVLFFLGYSYIRPTPSAFEIVVFVIIVAMVISGFTIVSHNIIEIKDNRIALASGPIAALLGALIVIIPLATALVGNVKKADGTCDIRGLWNCVRCEHSTAAELYEISEGGQVRQIEMRQNGNKWTGHFLFERNIVFIPNLQREGQSVIGVVSRDCKRIDWNYLWVWQRAPK